MNTSAKTHLFYAAVSLVGAAGFLLAGAAGVAGLLCLSAGFNLFAASVRNSGSR